MDMLRVALIVLASVASSAWCAPFELVIQGGRVMDPESGVDAVLNVGVNEGRIAAVSAENLEGAAEVDATGMVVAPGFIDLHAHGQDPRSNAFQAADGVTTALELEQGVLPVAEWLEDMSGRSVTHYGAASGHLAARIQLITGTPVGNPVYAQGQLPAHGGSSYANADLEGEALAKLLSDLEAGLLEGGLGIGSGITYMPGADHEEILALFQLAARYNVPVFTHIRQARHMGGDLLAPLQEVMANAAATGASLHVVHINSSLDESARTAVEMIRGARSRGIDITTESYPYTAGSTRLESALFENYQGDYGDLQWTETGERLTRETFEEYRAKGGWVIIHGRSEDTNRWLVAQPDIIVASDGVPFVGNFSHPRSAGTYARVLGRYVREDGALDLMTALAKMTVEPARRLEGFAPAMRRKGRLQKGADADIVVFDPETIIDQATYALPARRSAGIQHVLVGGTFVVRDGEPVAGVFPGQAIRSEVSPSKTQVSGTAPAR